MSKPASSDFTTISGLVEQYLEMPAVKETLAAYLLPGNRVQHCRLSYVGQSLHLICLLWLLVWQVLLCIPWQYYRHTKLTSLRTPKAAKELRWATDLAVRMIKHTACTISCSMAGMIMTERHIYLNLTEIKDKDSAFLLNAPSFNQDFLVPWWTVIVKFCTAKQQSAAFKQLPWQTEECSHSSFLQHPQEDHQKDLWSTIKSSQPAAQEGFPWSIGQETRAGSPIENCVRPLKHTGFSLCCLKESVLLISQDLASTTTAVHLYMLYDKLLSHAPRSNAFETHESCLNLHVSDVALSAGHA